MNKTFRPLRLPFARSSGRLVHASAAQLGELYTCPECDEPVVFKQCSQKRSHFSHRANSSCSGETVLHRTAKLLIAQILNDAIAGEGAYPAYEWTCDGCNEPSGALRFPLFDEASTEVQLASGHYVDVGLLRDGEPVAAIEVRVTHAVDYAKASSMKLDWLEVDGAAILDSPLDWTPLRGRWFAGRNRVRWDRCTACVERTIGFRKVVQELSRICQQPILETEWFRTAPHRCRNCDKGILVYDWADVLWSAVHESDMADDQIPRTIRSIGEPMGCGKGGVNVCPRCGALQTWKDLQFEPTGPFWCFRFNTWPSWDGWHEAEQMAYWMERVGGSHFRRHCNGYIGLDS